MMLPQFGDRLRIAGLDGAKEFPGLAMELIQIGPDGQAAGGHTKSIFKDAG